MSVHLIAPAPMAHTIATTKKGLATIFGTTTVKRPVSTQVASPSSPNRQASSLVVSGVSPSYIIALSIASLFPGNGTKRSSMDRAAERDWKDQAKQVFQLSTINDRGHFLPPTPTEKDYKENIKENGEDYFATIVSTPPEIVRTFLSTESTISPGMFSLPSNKIKRHTIPSFSAPSSAASIVKGDNNITPHHQVCVTAPAESLSTPPSSPPTVLHKDTYFLASPPDTPRLSQEQQRQQQQRQQQQRQQQQRQQQLRRAEDIRRRSRAQISFLTGSAMEEEEDEEGLSDALSDPFSSPFFSPSPPDLIMDEEGDHSSSGSDSSISSSAIASPNTSPRNSMTLPQKEHIRKMNEQKLRSQNFEGELRLGY
ncbi:hypothetical protein BGZ80_002252 [Entomortierella chlamydospora]|uniref:Uncharacterized protein n=1 Tax=Entomortierella chlamydospora TaxID=101097 RepID=A0A9P6N2E7_9FUNG|nr:hypothetical protein BGZ79_000592 [Entomortierella chlamydospora]KAG0021513.1 hypothetical protein BGZ80_002252 [Entomortierella chlamydospora]